MFRFKVRILGNKAENVLVDEDSTISDVKNILKDKYPLVVGMRAKFNGIHREDYIKMKSLGIRPKDIMLFIG